MSLVLWLPLNGNLENKGISQMPSTFTSVNAVYSTGKTTALAYDTSIPSTSAVCPELVGLTTFSVAYWAKIKEGTFSNWADLWALIATTNGQSAMRIRAERQNTTYPDREGLYMTKDTTMGGNTNNYYGAGTIDTQYKWYHTVMVKTPQQVKIYRNGVLTNTRDCSTYEIAPVTLTGTVVLGLAGSEAYLNDFRVYNHALSAAEVRELAKGLILHYKLDGGLFGNPNLALDTNTSTNRWNLSMQTGDKTNSIEYEGGTPISVITRGSTAQSGWRFLGYSTIDRSAIKTATDYTVSFDIYASVEGTIGFTGLVQSNAQNYLTASTSIVQNTVIANQWNHIILQCHTKDSFEGISVSSQIIYLAPSNNFYNVGAILKFKNMKFEEGLVVTPWCPADSELDIDRTIIEDSSGYGNDGNTAGTLTISSDTPRYNTSTYFNGSSYIITPAGSFAWNDLTSLTIAAWMKPTADMSGWRGSIGIAADAAAGARGFAITDYANTFRAVYTNGSTYVTSMTSGKTLPQNEWHHCAATLDGTTVKLYFDGNLEKTYTLDWGTATLHSKARIEVGVDLPGSDEKFTGNYSDVRIYCTPLLDTDIKQLYNVGMKVDKSQNIHAFEFAEQDGVTQFKRTGVIETAQVSDDLLFDKKAHIGKKSYPNILENTIDIVTTKDSNIKKGTIASIPAEQMQALAGKTLRLTYDVCADGDRSSTENGQTAYNYTRYGIHGSMAYTNGSGTTGTAYPFAGFLNYSGPATHAVQTWTVPTGYQTYGHLGFSIQNFDKPASNNNSTWFIQNVRLEVVETTSNGFVTGTQLIER